jgi:hypothetical protein
MVDNVIYPQQQPMFGPGIGQGAQGMFGGLRRGFRAGGQALHPYSNRLMLAGLGMLGGGPSDAMKGLVAGSALDTEDADRRKLNELLKGLQNDPEGGGLMAGLTEAERNYVANDPAAVRTLLAGKLGGGGQETYGMSGVWGKDPEGNPVFLQPSNRGGFRQAQAPEGVTLSPPGLTKVDGGTEWIFTDRDGNVVQRVPKDVAGEAAAQTTGTKQAEMAVAIPKVRQAAEQMRAMIADVKNDPNLGAATGWESNLPTLRGTAKFDTQQKVAQLAGQAFMQAYETLKGAGPIAVAEGEAATKAITRINTGLSDAEFLQALNDLDAYAEKAEEWARERAGQRAGNAAPAAEDPLGIR